MHSIGVGHVAGKAPAFELKVGRVMAYSEEGVALSSSGSEGGETHVEMLK